MEETTRQVLAYPEEDETSYLLQSKANKWRLLRAIHNVTQQQNLVEVEIDFTALRGSQSALRGTVDCDPPQALK